MTVASSVLDAMRSAFFGRTAESGGILGMRDGTVCRFSFDAGAADRGEYCPDTDFLNAEIAAWRCEEIAFCGLVHTHLGGCRELSDEDKKSIAAIYGAMQKPRLYFPIVTFDGEDMALTVYRIDSDGIGREGLDIA